MSPSRAIGRASREGTQLWPEGPPCGEKCGMALAFADEFHEPLGAVADVATLIEWAYRYYAALAVDSPALPVQFCGCCTVPVCSLCGARCLSDAFAAASAPGKLDTVAFLMGLAASHVGAVGLVKGAVLAGVLKVTGDLIGAWHAAGVQAFPGGRGELSILGKNAYPRPFPELVSEHIEECAAVVLTTGFPVVSTQDELWAASTIWANWGVDYLGRERYGDGEWPALRGRDAAVDAERALCLALGRGSEWGGRLSDPWLCDIAASRQMDVRPLLLGSELINFGSIGLVAETEDPAEFARAQVARLAVMVASSAVDVVFEAVAGERNLFYTLCAEAETKIVDWMFQRMRASWSPAETDILALYCPYVFIGPRHRFILKGLPPGTVRWDDHDSLALLLEAQHRHLATVEPESRFVVVCDCCDWREIAREMTAWIAAADGIDSCDQDQVGFLKLLDATGIDFLHEWHYSILRRCPGVADRHTVLLRAIPEWKIRAGVDEYHAYLAGADVVPLPGRPEGVAVEMAEELCERYHGFLPRPTDVARLRRPRAADLMLLAQCGPTPDGKTRIGLDPQLHVGRPTAVLLCRPTSSAVSRQLDYSIRRVCASWARSNIGSTCSRRGIAARVGSRNACTE